MSRPVEYKFYVCRARVGFWTRNLVLRFISRSSCAGAAASPPALALSLFPVEFRIESESEHDRNRKPKRYQYRNRKRDSHRNQEQDGVRIESGTGIGIESETLSKSRAERRENRERDLHRNRKRDSIGMKSRTAAGRRENRERDRNRNRKRDSHRNQEQDGVRIENGTSIGIESETPSESRAGRRENRKRDRHRNRKRDSIGIKSRTAIEPCDMRTDKQRSLGNRVPLAPFDYGTLRRRDHPQGVQFAEINIFILADFYPIVCYAQHKTRANYGRSQQRGSPSVSSSFLERRNEHWRILLRHSEWMNDGIADVRQNSEK
ncbi:hypothetical protein EVAR_12427_1 [Eumeta japonica]|uniref:Uncharacterized protein n=1 Tax=Eumeta variegata TaxID=151549 RepID=A0A4C1U0P1_EUMVA|nr:hypothetical protein EVAR_12427_1 [Eumeta japonica]